ncbi:hypothetical protein B0181_07515 [Moraxella caviae]|uniref:Uncharacterized protein n=1 Tax=Moraxella caviae TaxID=34060 RepID=A0A1T0A012_9GAMM|nr:hypothetical protein [Moraxella caviae]OOR89007.1 hypothetical protein B0181_07515 [Moraxella caviae]STZ14762.1 Uncharacterised protein [Moraxella caviae]VEW13979.1 Uncharacterised protein [Moraxella caviae]
MSTHDPEFEQLLKNARELEAINQRIAERRKRSVELDVRIASYPPIGIFGTFAVALGLFFLIIIFLIIFALIFT